MLLRLLAVVWLFKWRRALVLLLLLLTAANFPEEVLARLLVNFALPLLLAHIGHGLTVETHEEASQSIHAALA